MKLVSLLLVLALLAISCKSKSEAHREAQAWFNDSFVKCGEDYFAKYEQPMKGMAPLYVHEYGITVDSAIFQFKNLSLSFEDQEITSTEKLNGIEAKGKGFVRYSQFRYYEDSKWSSWADMPLIFAGQLMESLNKLTDRPNSPMFINLQKDKTGWDGKSSLWKKVSCAELPTL